ncbi:MAG: hypothetical protein JSS56_22085 [Proteobacteria bacterium]|nr:hypothetical protein [Pseudomonadota bacterium]
MPTAPNKSALKRRLDRYFWNNNTEEMNFFRQVYAQHFDGFDRVAVIGGLVRDFAHEGRAGFRSDIDLVIDAPQAQVEEIAQKLRAEPNRFGGFGCKQGPWKIDFWALETTWARRHVQVRELEDLLACTFFDWDAIAYDLKRKRVICDDDYLERIRKGTLDINLLPNPSPLGNLVRATRRLIVWRVQAGPALKDFIRNHLDDSALKYIKEKEAELYSHPVSTRWGTASEARRALLHSHAKARVTRQLELQLD